MKTGGACLAAALLLLAASPTAAAEVKLNAAEIEALLSGNTALGEHRGKSTRQYFDAGGGTDYLPQGGMVDRGRWKADHDKNQYCSWWERGGWSCYDVLRDDETYFWSQESSGYRSPFTMTTGRQLSF